MNAVHDSTTNAELSPSREADTTNAKIEALEKRIAELEATVRALRIHVRMPYGKFAHLGGYEVSPPREFETSKKPVDFSSIGGKCVCKAPETDAPEEE